MLLELYDKSHTKLGSLTGIKSPHIQRTLEYGDETLDFSYPTSGQWLEKIQTECYVRTDRQEYVIKAVEKTTTSAWRKVSCSLNIEELEGTPFEGFEAVEQTLKDTAEFALEGTPWTVEAADDITKRRTIRKEDDTTAWEVVKQIVNTYRVELEIDAVKKRLIFRTKRGGDKGAYFIERLNLRSLGVKSSSYGFYTRLIPIGKDGLHLWQDGINYLDNHQYSDKVITQIWRDERYTVTAALREDALARLEEASRPARAYTADLIDLAAQSDKYSTLEYDLGDAVLLVSETAEEREKQRIVKLDEYPDEPTQNKAELSNVKQTFAQLQKREDELATQEAVNISSKKIEKVLKDGYMTTEETRVAISALEESILLEVSVTTNAENMLLYKNFEDLENTQHSEVENGEIKVSFLASETSVFSIQEKANPELWKLAQGKAVKVSGYYKVTKPFNAAAITLRLGWNYTAGTEQTLYYTQNAPIKTDVVGDDWTYYEKTYTSELLDEELKNLYMYLNMDPQKAETDGEIMWKEWSLEISPPVQVGNIRSKFAMDASSVTIDTGKLTFNSNTIVINSTNFKLDSYGNVTAMGTFQSQNGEWVAELRAGGLFMKYGGNQRVRIFKAGNYDAGYLILEGNYDGTAYKGTYSSDGITLEKLSDVFFRVTGTGDVSANTLQTKGDVWMPDDNKATLWMRKSKLQPCSGQNALYCNWVAMKGIDGNTYWALCGFNSYPGT